MPLASKYYKLALGVNVGTPSVIATVPSVASPS